MNKLTRSLLILTTSFVLVSLTGCAKRPKNITDDGTYGTTGMGETDYASGNDLAARGDFNPQTDADYAKLNSAVGAGSGTIYFDTDSTVIGESERAKLGRVAQWLSSNSGERLLAAGHCDDRGTLEYNRALGERRAIAVRDYLIARGVDGSRLFTFSYGEDKPASSGGGESAWSANRRVELGIIVK